MPRAGRTLAGMGVLDYACPGQLAGAPCFRCLEAAGRVLEQFGQPQRSAVLEHRIDVDAVPGRGAARDLIAGATQKTARR